MAGVQILPENLRSIDSATFTGVYQAVGPVLAHPASLVKFVNNSNVTVLISWDGINDNDVIPANSFALYDIEANHSTYNECSIRKGTQFYVKAAVGIGLVYITVLYIVQG